ncbi:DUF4270 family protein [Dinghuibacter silviterrae]|nr:DUF4270 family protein [Dinghuibacter silviterrae]
MRFRLLWLGMLGLLGVYGLSGCVKANIIFGQNQIDDGLTKIVKIDTLTPVLSTLFVDSVPTSGKGVAMVGGYDDPYFGSVKTRTYFEFAPPPVTNLGIGYYYDSLVLYVVPNKYYYGDTTQPMDFYAEQIASQMLFPPTNYSFYNNDSFAVRSPVLGHVRSVLRPSVVDTVYIRLNDSLGQTFFNLMKNNSPTITNADEFLVYFPGIRISSGYGANPQLVYGYKDSVFMKLWYHTSDLNRSINAMTFKFTQSSYQFMEVQNTPIAPLTKFQRGYSSVVRQIYSTDPDFNHLVYVDPLLGYSAKVEFPYLRNMLLQDTTMRIITKAELILRPLVPSYSTQYLLPPSLVAESTDYSNEPSSTVSTGVLTLDYGTSNTQYTFDITSYLQEQLNDPTSTAYKRGLIIAPSSTYFYSSLNRFVFGDKDYQSQYTSPTYYQSEVILYYVSTKNTL